LEQKRVLSGVRASGDLHLGNYLGALRQWVSTQDDRESFYFIADLHGLTEVGQGHNPVDFAEKRLRTAAAFLAAGLDPSRVTLFFQSSIPQHTEVMWYLSTVARKGELERMTQWKDKASGDEVGASAGLFVYPILMASDILLYDADEVPVGDDQRQHVEVTRDWAARFNSYFGTTFVIPEAVLPPEAARVMDLQYPEAKMSKSAASGLGSLLLDDSADDLRSKIRRAVTDADTSIHRSREKPGVTNLIEIHAALTRRTPEEVEREFVGKTYSEFKNAVADAVISELSPIGRRIEELLGDRGEISRLLSIGAERAREVAERTCLRAREALGVGSL